MPDLDEQGKSRLRRKWDVLQRRATADKRILPDFFIAGVQKAGTTSLYSYMAQHPQILPALKKEIYYFAERFTRGQRWYRSHFPTRRERDALSAQLGLPVLTGESTPYYIYHPLALQRIHAMIPQARLVILLRNPTERAYSHYNHAVKRGEEPLGSFEAALDAEEARLAGEVERLINEPGYHSYSHKFQSYLAPGRYIEQLRVVAQYFDREQCLIMDCRELYSDPQAVCDKVADFLGLQAATIPDLGVRNATPSSAIDPAVKQRLDSYFEPWNRELYAYLGEDLGW